MQTSVKQFVDAEKFKSNYEALRSLEQIIGKEVQLEVKGWEWEEPFEWNVPIRRSDAMILEGILGQRLRDGVLITHVVGYHPESNTDRAYVTNAVDEVVLRISADGRDVWTNPQGFFFCEQGMRTPGMALEEYRRANPLQAESKVLTSPKFVAIRMGSFNRFLDRGVIEDIRIRYLETPEVTKLLPKAPSHTPPVSAGGAYDFQC